MHNSSFLDYLRERILLKCGLKLISPSDCKSISLAIQKELNKNISETTVKRLFGFAAAKTKFSKFTINAFTEFVANVEEQNQDFLQNSSIYANNIEKITQNAKHLTNITLQGIRNRCSVPYELTIPRKFAIHDFHYFYASNYSFTAFIAHPGYGKTILLSHLVQDTIMDEDGPYTKDVICYLNANQAFDSEASQVPLENIIKAKIGLSSQSNLINYFDEQHAQSNIHLILIFDGFTELVLNHSTKIKLFDRIIDFISLINESKAVKLILSMRSTTWNRFYERMRHSYFLKKKWFPGSYYYLDYNSNVPPLSEKELELVIEKMDPGNFEKINSNLKSHLKFPFHIQWFYRLKEEYPSFNFYTNVIFYEIIWLFIQEKIFKSNYATEKTLFCRKVIKLTDLSKKGDKVLKSELIEDLSYYKNAYMELLSEGILMEEKNFHGDYPTEYVRFVHPHIFEYFLFIELFEHYAHKIDTAFFNHIQQGNFNSQIRYQLLQWVARQLIIAGTFEPIPHLFSIKLTNYERNYLIYFIAEKLSYRIVNYPKLAQQIKEQSLHEKLMKELVHYDFVDSCYKDAIESLLNTVDTDANALFYNTILAITECLSFNQEKIAIRLKKIENIKHVSENSLVNPYEIINLIYLKLKGVIVPSTNKTLVRLEAIKDNKIDLNSEGLAFPFSHNLTSILLIILLNAFYGSQEDSIKILNIILKSYPKLIKTKNSFSFHLLSLLALSNARINPGRKTDQMERVITKFYENKLADRPTLYSQSLLLILKAQQSKNRKEYQKAISLINEGITIFNRNELFIYELMMYNLLISIYTQMQDFEKANRYNHKKISLLEERKIPYLNLKYVDFD